LQAAQDDRRDAEHRMHRAAEAVTDGQRHSRTHKRKADRKVKPELVNTEPPPSDIPEFDLFPDAIGRRIRFAESDRDNAKRNQHEPNYNHEDGVVLPMNWDRRPRKSR
jgi:hypothetical protein